jgi:hypothetical protein
MVICEQVNMLDPFQKPMTEFQSSITSRMLKLSESYHQTLQACDITAYVHTYLSTLSHHHHSLSAFVYGWDSHYFGEDTGLVWEHMFRIFTSFLTSYHVCSDHPLPSFRVYSHSIK